MSKLNRRNFLGLAGASAIGVAATPLLGAGTANAAMSVSKLNTPSQSIGLQLYSVRNLISGTGAVGFAATFEELARIGFNEVEFAGYTQGNVGAITTAQIKGLLDGNGLKAIGSHISWNNLTNPSLNTLEFERAVELGMPFIGTANDFPGTTVAAIQAGAALFAAAQVKAATYGLRIYQHNHANEFMFTDDAPSRRRYEIFIEAVQAAGGWAAGAFLEMDILWAYGGARKYAVPGGSNNRGVPLPGGAFGFDPADWVAANPERYVLFHTKDGLPNTDPAQGNSYTPAEFGAGTIDFRSFFKKVGAKTEHHPLWEHDNAPSTPAVLGGAMGAAERSFDAMFATRTLTWLDELAALVARLVADGRVKAAVGDDLLGRVNNAIKRYEGGHEESAIGYLGQFIAKVNNQVKGDADAKAVLMGDAQIILDWLQQSEDKENGVV
ncbi:sugar phosphate isomerase/epimerase family protein [Motilibacter aurantiacus]|uniref:sugar phosphate isomerase/epimerase family protein n=1 Tax=Motilibacter aurantiacus TaxID=2714955 RepID=UPI0014082BF9|nr:TIM barrel protein [Motilibacter aurantiacus]NHC47539.1 sugar phosphate isomerase/epimerase [Motilibacter aurantiacus]